jgi:hypothetical protein
MNEQVFELLQEQHRDVMKGLDELKALHADHIKEDVEVHKMVERHNLYFNIAFLGIPAALSTLAYKFGFK